MKKEKWNRKKFYITYTILACLLFLWIIFIHLSTGKSSIWENDAIKQHYISLAYYGNYLRNILKNLFISHTLEIPMWDIHIGYGADVATTLHYYVLGDPLNLLAVFVPENKTEYLYEALILLRIYLGGITFSRFCFFHKHREFPVLIGTFIYISSIWMVSVGFNHIFFLMPTVYFPLVLLGIDKIFEERKPFIYISAIALSALSNFYFFYMIGIFTVIYGVIRYLTIYRKIQFKKVIYYMGRFCLYSILGISIASVILLPVIMSTIHTERFGISYFIPILYSKAYYKELPVILTSSGDDRYTLIGVAGVCFFALIVLFFKRRKYLGLKAGVILFFILYCIPFAGHILNGFSYVSNRWSWAAVLFFSYLFVAMYPEFFFLSKKERGILLGIAVFYGGYILYFFKKGNIGGFIAGIIIIITAFLLCTIKKKQFLAAILAVSVAISGIGNICYAFMLENGTWARPLQNLDIGQADEMVHSDVYKALKQKPEISVHRYEQNTSTIYNTGMLNKLNSGQFYFSIAQEGINSFFEKNYICTLMEQVVLGLNNRAWLMKLFGMKYCIEDGDRIPYGYEPSEPVEIYDGNCQIYEDTNPLALVYTYGSYIPTQEYEKMKGEQRQEAMLQGVVLEKSGLPLCKPKYTSHEVSYKISKAKGVEILDNKFAVSDKNAECLIEIDGKEECETYVSFQGLRYEGYELEDSPIFEGEHIDSGVMLFRTYCNGKKGGQTIPLRSYKNNFQDNRKNYMANLGFYEDGIKKIKLKFSQPGIYSFKNMRIICQEMGTLNRWANERKEDEIQDFSIHGNNITCNLSLNGNKAVVFSVPYSPGWSAMADGKPIEIKKANEMFMGIELSSGYHEIKLFYKTPYICQGMLLSIAGLVLTVLLAITYKKFFKRNLKQ